MVRTGTRSGLICNASFAREVGKAWKELKTETTVEERIETWTIDGEVFERRVQVPVIKRVAIFHRKAIAKEAKKNKQARMPDCLVNQLWRWHHKLGQRYVVEWQDKPVGSKKRSVANLCYDLGFGDDVVRHTAVTWGMQAGTDIRELAGFIGMTVEKRYGHHSDAYMKGARKALGGRRLKQAA